MAQVINDRDFGSGGKNTTPKVVTTNNSSKTTSSSSKSTTSSTKNVEEYDFENGGKSQEEIAKEIAEERQRLLEEDKARARAEAEERFQKMQNLQIERYNKLMAECKDNLDKLKAKNDFFNDDIVNIPEDELGILAEGKVRETNEYGDTTLRVMAPSEYKTYLESFKDSNGNNKYDELDITLKYSEYKGKYEEMFYKITRTQYDEFSNDVNTVQKDMIDLRASMPKGAKGYAIQLEEYINMVNDIVEKSRSELDELNRRFANFSMGMTLDYNGQLVNINLDKDVFALLYKFDFKSPESIKFNPDDFGDAGTGLTEWFYEWARELGYSGQDLNPMSEDYQNLVRRFDDYITKEYTEVYNKAFEITMGKTREQYNNRVTYLQNELNKYEPMLYDLRQEKKKVPYLEIAETDDYKKYKGSSDNLSIEVLYDDRGGSYYYKVYKDGVLVEDLSKISQLEINRLLDEKLKGNVPVSLGYDDTYKYLDAEEKKMYNYLFETQGKKAANDYLEAIKDNINKAKAKQEFDNYIESISTNGVVNNDLLSSLITLFNGFGSGMEGFEEGISNVFTADGVMTDNQYFQMYVLQALANLKGLYVNAQIEAIKASGDEEGAREFASNIYNINGNIDFEYAKTKLSTNDYEQFVYYMKQYDKEFFMDEAFEFGMTAGNMAPAQVLALVSNLVAPGSGEWVATAAIGLSSMGNNANQKLIEGHDKLSAYTYGAITGASEALLEKLLGNIGFLNEGASFSLKGILSEISGELIQMGVESYVNEAMYGELVDANALGEEALKTVIYTALLSGLSTGGQTISNIAINGSKANITNFSSFCDFVGMMNSGDISLVKNSDGKYTCVLKSDADVSSSMLAEIESMFPGVPIMQNVSGGLAVVYDPVLNGDMGNDVDVIKNGNQNVPSATAVLTKPDKGSNKGTTTPKKPTTIENNDSFHSPIEAIRKELSEVNYGKNNPITYVVEYLKSNFRKFLYKDTSSVSGLNEQIMENGLYHFTTAADAILESGYIKASDMTTSYGNSKSFFFNGVPEVGAFATNLDSIPLRVTAVRVQPTTDLVIDPKLKVRYADDMAITYDGNFDLSGYNAEKCLFVLAIEDGKLVYKQVSESDYINYDRTNMGKVVSEYIADKSNIAAIKNDFLTGISLRNTGGNVVDSSDVVSILDNNSTEVIPKSSVGVDDSSTSTEFIIDNSVANIDDVVKIVPEEFMKALKNGKLNGINGSSKFVIPSIKIINGKSVNVDVEISVEDSFSLLLDNTLANKFFQSLSQGKQYFSQYQNIDVINALAKCVEYLKNNNFEIDFTDSISGLDNSTILMNSLFNSQRDSLEITVKKDIYSSEVDSYKFGVDQNAVIDVIDSKDDYLLKQKLEEMVNNAYIGISSADVESFLKSINVDRGICNYANICNAIFEYYEGKPDIFEQKFGFPMYYNGKLNDAQLLLDVFINVTGNTRMIYENGKWSYNNVTSYINFDNSTGSDVKYRLELLENYLKIIGLYGDGSHLLQKQIFNSNTQSLSNMKEDILKKISDGLKNGEHLSIASGEGLLMKDVNTNMFAELTGGHIMSIYGIDSNGNLLVSSWGRKCVVYLDIALNSGVEFTIDSLDIKLSEMSREHHSVSNTEFKTITINDVPHLSIDELVSYLLMLDGDSKNKIINLLSDSQIQSLLDYFKDLKTDTFRFDSDDLGLYQEIVSSLSLLKFNDMLNNKLIQFSNGEFNIDFEVSDGKSLSADILLSILSDKDIFNMFINGINNDSNGTDINGYYSNTEILIGFSKLIKEFKIMGYLNTFDGIISELSDLINRHSNIIEKDNSVGTSSNVSNVTSSSTDDSLSDLNLFNSSNNYSSSEEMSVIEKEIMSNMPQGLDDISKIRYLYLELNKRLHYDNNYRFTDQTTRDEMLNKITTFNNLEGNKVVCKGWAELFRELLIKNGVPEDSVNVVGEQHRWVEINIGDKIIRADATDLFNGTFDLDTSKNGSSTVGFLLLDNSYKGVNLNNKFDSNGNPVLDSNGNPTRIYKTLGDEYYNNVSNWLREIDNKIGYTDNGLYYLENLEKAKNEFYSPSLVEKIFGVNKQKEYDTKLTKFLDIKVPDGMDAYESIFYFERVRDVIFGDLAKNISVYPMKRILPDGTIVAATIIKTTGLDVYDTKHLKIIDDVSGVSDILDFDNLGQVENYLKSSGYVAWTK